MTAGQHQNLMMSRSAAGVRTCIVRIASPAGRCAGLAVRMES